MILAGRGRRDGVSHREESEILFKGGQSGLRKVTGDAGSAMLSAGSSASVMIVQSRR